MPSWDSAATRKVEDSQHEDVEMGNLAPSATRYDGVVSTAGHHGRSGYTEIQAGPDTPYAERTEASYRATDTTNPFTPGQEVLGGPKTEETSGAPGRYSNRRSQGYVPRASGGAGYSPAVSNEAFHRASYGQPYDSGSPQYAQPYTDYNDTLNHRSSPAYQPAQRGNEYHDPLQTSYSGYTPSTSTRYEPSAYELPGPGNASHGDPGGVANRPPSLLQAGRKPVQDSWKAV